MTCLATWGFWESGGDERPYDPRNLELSASLTAA